jgi:hypothetical protein
MKEDFLHYIWKKQLFDKTDLFTINGEKIQIIGVGEHNTNAGPDFLNAKIKIEGLIWVGNVEIHINSSDWHKHKHHNDKAYNNVILHLVYNDDKTIKTQKGEIPQTLKLKNKIDLKLLTKYQQVFDNKENILCSSYLPSVNDEIWESTLQKLTAERFNNKVLEIEDSLCKTNNDLEWVLFFLLAQSLGLKVNKQAMQMLTQSIPFKLLINYQANSFQFSALLFGQAGFLEQEFNEGYPTSLKLEYQYLKQKHKLLPLEKFVWKFLRLRPASFPAVRIAQLQVIMSQSQFYSKIKHAIKYEKVKELLKVELDEYWDRHYVFDKLSVVKKKKLGAATLDVIIINAIVPLYFFIARKDEKYKGYATDLLKVIKAEQNSIAKRYKIAGKKIKSAADSQALIQLYNFYCIPKKCLTCNIGKQLMKDD